MDFKVTVYTEGHYQKQSCEARCIFHKDIVETINCITQCLLGDDLGDKLFFFFQASVPGRLGPYLSGAIPSFILQKRGNALSSGL